MNRPLPIDVTAEFHADTFTSFVELKQQGNTNDAILLDVSAVDDLCIRLTSAKRWLSGLGTSESRTKVWPSRLQVSTPTEDDVQIASTKCADEMKRLIVLLLQSKESLLLNEAQDEFLAIFRHALGNLATEDIVSMDSSGPQTASSTIIRLMNLEERAAKRVV